MIVGAPMIVGALIGISKAFPNRLIIQTEESASTSSVTSTDTSLFPFLGVLIKKMNPQFFFNIMKF